MYVAAYLSHSLRRSSTALGKLREKLFLLWGDLEERKARKSTTLQQINGNVCSPKKEITAQSRPFQCCLKEYGIKKRTKLAVEEVDNDSGNDSGSDVGSQTDQDLSRIKSGWTWERKWMMFGCTII